MLKKCLCRSLPLLAALLLPFTGAAQELMPHKNVLKNFQWPTPITIGHFVNFTKAAPLGLNIFTVPENTQCLTVKWQDNALVTLTAEAGAWRVKNSNVSVYPQDFRIPAGKLEAAVDSSGVIFRTADKKMYRIWGGLVPDNITLMLPAKVKVPQIKSVYAINDILLWLCADEAEKELNRALKLFDDQKETVQKSWVYLTARYVWQTNIRQQKNNLAKVKAEAEKALDGFLPALVNDPIVRDRCNWLLYMGMRQGAVTGGYFGGGFYNIWSEKLLGRGEVLGAMHFADMIRKLVSQARRVDFVSFKEGVNYKNILSSGFVSALEYVPLQAGLPADIKQKASLRCARGEGESVQLLLTAGSKDVTDISVTAAARTPDAPALELYRVECINLIPAGSVQMPLNRGGDVPEFDVCIPVKKGEKFKISKHTNQPFQLTVQTLNSTMPGVYEYDITVKVHGRKAAELPLSVKVEEFALQERIPNLPGLRPENITMLYSDKEVVKSARMNLIKQLFKHRMDPLNLYRPSPLVDDMPWCLRNGLQAALLDGKLEKLADPRPEMPQYIELYGSRDGKKFERIAAKALLDKRDKQKKLSPLDLVVNVEVPTAQYKYFKLHYSQPTDTRLKGHIYYYEALGKGRQTMLINNEHMVKQLRMVQPDKNCRATWQQAKNAGLIKFDLLNRTLHSTSVLWENSVGDVKTLRFYNHMQERQMKKLKPFYDKVRETAGREIPVYLYGFDERGEKYNMQMLSAMKNARLAFDNVKFVTTATNPEADPELFKYLDVHCRSIGKSDVRLNMSTAQKYGTDYWIYIGGGPFYPFSNFERVDQPRINSRAFFWSMIAYDHIKGWLYWSINHWKGNDHFKDLKEYDWSLWRNNHGSFNGMRAFFYPGPGGEIYPSLRAGAMRDGLEDVELFRLAQKLVKSSKDKAELEEIRKGYASGLSTFCQDIKTLEIVRSRLYDLLARVYPALKITQLDLNNFNSGKNNFFHPAVTPLQDGRWFATTQIVKNSDFYGEPEYAISSDQGKSWTKLQTIPALTYRPLPDKVFFQAVADNRPFTLQNGSVAVFGCSTYYVKTGRAGNDPKYKDLIPAQAAYYALWDPKTEKWSDRMKLELPGLRHYRAACTQITLLDDDKIIVPFYLAADQTLPDIGSPGKFGVLTAIYRYVDGKLVFLRRSRIMTNTVKRGLIEPSIVRLPDKSYALTIRAEDDRMYCAFSKDGIEWSEPEQWRWDDGTFIRSLSTQQHWITLGDRVFLVYTRFDGSNFPQPLRYRGPLYMAEVIPGKARLIRTTEKVVFPRKNIKGIEARYGNFHCVQLDRDRALITDSALFVKVIAPRRHRDVHTIVKAALVTP